jgi:hypothetical protein
MSLFALTVTGTMTVGDALVAAGTFLLAVFAAFSAVEAMSAVREARALDDLNVRRAEYRRSREMRGVARLVYQEVIGNQRIALEALDDDHWAVSSGVTHRAWDNSAALIMEEVAEDVAEKLGGFFAALNRWDAHGRLYSPDGTRHALGPGANRHTSIRGRRRAES